MDSWKERDRVARTARALLDRNLTSGTSGNVSARSGSGFLITPSGIPYTEMKPGDVVAMDLDGRAAGPRAPSSEWRLHRGLYAARPEIGAVVHAHPRYATALAATRREIPPFHYMVAIGGGKTIRCAPYAPFGSDELARHALEALRERRACLLANHGCLAVGPDLETALELAIELEWLCAQYCTVLAIGEVVLLDDREMDEVLERFATYGQPKAPRPF